MRSPNPTEILLDLAQFDPDPARCDCRGTGQIHAGETRADCPFHRPGAEVCPSCQRHLYEVPRMAVGRKDWECENEAHWVLFNESLQEADH